MTLSQVVDSAFLIAGSFIIAVVLLRAMWYFVLYVFMGGDDQERAHAKNELLTRTITLMFIMILWWLVSLIGRLIGL